MRSACPLQEMAFQFRDLPNAPKLIAYFGRDAAHFPSASRHYPFHARCHVSAQKMPFYISAQLGFFVVVFAFLLFKLWIKVVIKQSFTYIYVKCIYYMNTWHTLQMHILNCFIRTIISSVVTFAMTCRGGNASKQDKNRLSKNVKNAGGVMGRWQESTDTAMTDWRQTINQGHFGWQDAPTQTWILQ